MMRFDNVDELPTEGFQGFVPVRALQGSRCQEVPDKPGVYLVLRPQKGLPVFLRESTGGHFKGRDPAVPVNELQNAWVDGALVVYIGKAGGPGKDATLRSRLRQYMRFGEGEAVGHWGGRYIWQLHDSSDLTLCWKPTPGEAPRDVEKKLIAEFEAIYGKQPFANLAR